jgi:hypothetical protein
MERAIRRAIDLLIGGLGSIVSAPLVVTLIVLIRLESPGDPLYTQVRVGRDGVPFRIYKLRTMVSGAEFQGAGLAICEGDSRITRLGALLRRTSLDELPNLWNVVRGEMSIVGPRPTLQHQVDAYTGPGQRPRLTALARAHRARPLVRRAPLAAPGREDPEVHRRPGRPRRRHLQGPGRGLAAAALNGNRPPFGNRSLVLRR